MLKTKVMLPEGCPEVSPWGAVDYGLAHGDGVFLVGTPSHGGFKLPPKVNKTIPELFRRSGGWYEEDCDWAIPVHFLPDLLPDKKIVAKQTLIEWHWQSWEKLTGEIIQPGQSHNKDAFVFKESHKNDFLGVAAFGDWHANVPTGMVGVIASRGGVRNGYYKEIGAVEAMQHLAEEKMFLVSAAEYSARTENPGGIFVVDLKRHAEWIGP